MLLVEKSTYSKWLSNHISRDYEKRFALKRHIYMVLNVFKIRKNGPRVIHIHIDSKVSYPKFVNTCKLLNIRSSYIYFEQ